MNVGLSDFKPVAILSGTCKWFANKTRSIGCFFCSKISKVSNTSKKMDFDVQERKKWKLDPKIHEDALTQVRSGVGFEPKISEVITRCGNTTPGVQEAKNWKLDSEKRYENYQATLRKVRCTGVSGVDLAPKCLKSKDVDFF